MAEPSKHPSRSRSRRRKAHLVLKKKNLVKCPNCQALILTHRVCPDCGFKKGKPIIIKKDKNKKPKK
ncbi:MAG: 50S ribosomal protein L32 [Patescibacteria group bacterium]|nr:50S ribosomal protein L32 [Patescibacteria group bacterium]MCL5257855.1 50S ribosomal protein L32 [Patescibacteria group bacterium]